ncbi:MULTISPECIES: YcaO-like family protein [unclassified Streptomyces]|uniref:YcaO-like family protein n=1 Tax=unclassified Streptomyces TaxID=2593676 RepID=UPI0004CAD98A|nr:YcaO-like family protein [Streptomyces sp. NRRL F-2747]
MRTPLHPGRADELLLAVLRPSRPRPPSDDGERSVVLVEAAARAERAIRVLGLHRDMVSFGGDPTVHGCTLRLRDGTVVARGTGAGDAFAARTGALLEALEQYAAVRRHRARYVDLATGRPAAAEASGALCGTGLGCTPADATLHALLEAVQRFTVAGFAARATVPGGCAHPCASVLDRSTLPSALADTVRSTERRIGADIRILLLDEDDLVPVYLAHAFTGRAGDGHIGLGTSLSETVAVRRACRRLLERSLPDEAGTGWHPAGPIPYAEGPETADALGAAMLPRGAGGTAPVPFVRDRALSTSSAHLVRLVGQLSARGHRVRAATIAALPAGLVLSKALLLPAPPPEPA